MRASAPEVLGRIEFTGWNERVEQAFQACVNNGQIELGFSPEVQTPKCQS